MNKTTFCPTWLGKVFMADSYHTPTDIHPRWQHWPDTAVRLGFIVGFFKRTVQSWRLVRQGKYDRKAWAKSSLAIFQFVEQIGGRFHITGLDFLQQPGPFVFVSNHMSSLETAVMPGLIAPIMPVTFVAKATIMDYPFLGQVILATAPILVKRKNPREDFQVVMRQGREALTQGTSVVIYPQSTRTAVFDPQTFNSLGIKLARKANAPIIPIAVKTDFWENGRRLKDFGPIHRKRPIHIAFGKPFNVDSTSKEAHQHTIAFIQNHLAAWKKNAPAAADE
ncbi:MAG: 1-acyl-sn-glycerol-3-phosphate acyltransferase [Chloroflexi bacterium]|nr:1-acyl-sn-glycerol-3-phosphate acyltransferase [Chloroflexota bacterium]